MNEDSAGPKFVKAFDIDNDDLMDLVTAWNQSQPVQIHLQRRDTEDNISFVSVNLGGTGPISLIAGVDMADFDLDGWLDVAVLVKATGGAGICPTPGEDPPFQVGGDEGEVQLLFNPGNRAEITDGDTWQEVRLGRSQLAGRRDQDIAQARTLPEFNGYTGIVAGEIDGFNGPDLVLAYNPIACEFYGDEPPLNRILFLPNPGGANSRDPGAVPLTVTADAGPDQAVRIPAPEDPDPKGAEVILDGGDSFNSFFSGGVGYFWEQVGGPAVDMAGITSANPIFTAPITSAALTFRLTASAGSATDFDHVSVVVGGPANLPPEMTASGDQTIIPDATSPDETVIEMFAFAFDPNGDTVTYEWTQVFGDPVVLSGADTPAASFRAPELGGELRFRVTASDGTLFDSDLVVITTGVWAPIRIDAALARASDVEIMDVDLDGDNDLVYTFPDQITSNVTWARNPAVPHDEISLAGPQEAHSTANWQIRPVGHVDTEADVISLGDVDLDGYDDVLVRSRNGLIVQWFRHPGGADQEPIFPPPDVVPDRFNFPWQVYTMVEAGFRLPAAIAVGDLTGDGFNEVLVGAGGVVNWYDASVVESVYDTWGENFVIDDTKANGVTDDPNDPDFADAGTVIYSLTVVDLDDDGFGDVIGTLDRRVFSGLADDTLIWFRNTLG
ncbi:MAG: FG-GAP repeat domain-containing protein, partial [Planctomycetota bacterium]